MKTLGAWPCLWRPGVLLSNKVVDVRMRRLKRAKPVAPDREATREDSHARQGGRRLITKDALTKIACEERCGKK